MKFEQEIQKIGEVIQKINAEVIISRQGKIGGMQVVRVLIEQQ